MTGKRFNCQKEKQNKSLQKKRKTKHYNSIYFYNLFVIY